MIISDALATQLLNVAPDPTVIVDGNGTIIYAESSDDPHDLPDFDAIKAALKA